MHIFFSFQFQPESVLFWKRNVKIKVLNVKTETETNHLEEPIMSYKSHIESEFNPQSNENENNE